MYKEVKPIPQSKSSGILSAGIDEFSRFSYADANTDRITASCGISKGLLYHYFGSKRDFYLFCLQHTLKTLAQADYEMPAGDFYELLFSVMEQKLKNCADHPAETRLLNMAARESSTEVKTEKDELFAQYAGQMRSFSEKVLKAAISTLPLKKSVDGHLAAQCLSIYTNALINRYLLLYQDEPEKFFLSKETITKELRSNIDLMLYGVCEVEQ